MNFKNWIIASNHYKHILACFIIALLEGLIPAITVGIAVEYKDKLWGGKFDWNDIAADCIGAIIGAIVRFFILQDLTRVLC